MESCLFKQHGANTSIGMTRLTRNELWLILKPDLLKVSDFHIPRKIKMKLVKSRALVFVLGRYSQDANVLGENVHGDDVLGANFSGC